MPPIPLPLDRPLAVNVQPGGEVTLSGSYYVSHDGSRIGPTTTHWPKERPGGESTDPLGLIDLEASGMTLGERETAQSPAKLIAGPGSPVCKAAGISGACLVPRTMKLANDRGITMAELMSQMKGDVLVDVPAPPALAPLAPAFPFLGVAAGLGAAIAIGLVALRVRKRRIASPAGQLLALARRVQGKLVGADAVVAAPLGRAVETALRALKAGRVDAASAEGKRVQAVLLRVETQLDTHAAKERETQEREAADELVREVESALEAAEEASALGARTAK
jgi:hypothetical protein